MIVSGPITGGWAYWTFEIESDGHGEQVESRKSGECHNPVWIFRFPRNSVVAGNLEKEQAVLPRGCPIGSTSPYRVSSTAGYWNGQPYVGYRRIPGRPLSDHPIASRGLADESGGSVAAALPSRELSDATAVSIASALSSLHDIPPPLVAEACAVEPTINAWRQRYQELRETVRTRVSPLLDPRTHEAVERGFERFLDEELATLEDVAVVHCDLGCEHILIGDDGTTVTGLIDFEDVTIGDPTIDFVGIFVTYGLEAVEKVKDSYRRRRALDEHFERRLYSYTWMASCHQVIYGVEEGKPDLVEDGVEGLRTRLGM